MLSNLTDSKADPNGTVDNGFYISLNELIQVASADTLFIIFRAKISLRIILLFVEK